MPLAPFIEVPKRNPNGSVVLGPDGRPVMGIAPNPPKQHVRSFWIPPAEGESVVLGALGSTELHFEIDQQGHFDWAYIVGVSTGAYLLRFFDGGCQRLLQNKPVHSVTVVGSAQRPFRLPQPYFFNVGDSQRELQCTITDLTGVSNTVRLAIYGRRFYHHEAQPDVAAMIAKKFGGGWRTYTYFLVPKESIDGAAVTLAAGASDTFTFDMDNDAHTELTKFMFSSTGAFTFRLRERDTNRALMTDVVHNLNGIGNAEFPFNFADGYLLEANKQLLIEVTDISGQTNNLFLTLAGRRLDMK
jgi:hypothetical protein